MKARITWNRYLTDGEIRQHIKQVTNKTWLYSGRKQSSRLQHRQQHLLKTEGTHACNTVGQMNCFEVRLDLE
jgi:hypothetical protein